GQRAEAVTVFVAAARLRAMLGELEAADQLLDGLDDLARELGKRGEVTRARAELADQRGDLAARERAWQAAFDSGDPGQRLFALLRLADVARARPEQDAAARLADLLDQAVPLVPADEPAQLADLHIE